MYKIYFFLSALLFTTIFVDNNLASTKIGYKKETINEINNRAINRSLRMKIFEEAGKFKTEFIKKFKELIGMNRSDKMDDNILVYQFDKVFSSIIRELKDDVNSENIASGKTRGDSGTSTQEAFKEAKEKICTIGLPQSELNKKLLLLDLYGIDSNSKISQKMTKGKESIETMFEEIEITFNKDLQYYNNFISKNKSKLSKYLINDKIIGKNAINVEKLANDLMGKEIYKNHKEKMDKMIAEYEINKDSETKETDYAKKISRSKLG